MMRREMASQRCHAGLRGRAGGAGSWWTVSFGVALVWVAVLLLPAAAAAITLPIRLDTTRSLREQFGYAPDYQRNVPSFDAANRPAIRDRTAAQDFTSAGFLLRSSGGWRRSALLAAVRRACPGFVATVNGGGYVSERIEFDTGGRAYTLLEVRVRNGALYNVLVYSTDDCRTWTAVKLPFGGKRTIYDGRDGGTAMLEQYAGWNRGATPPLVAVWKPISDWPGKRASRNALYVLKPRFRSGRLVLPAPSLVSDRFIGAVNGAGGASFACSCAEMSYLVWAEVARSSDTGTPTYAAAFENRTRMVSAPVLLAEAAPRNDDHDTPGIVRDGAGYLHVVTGAHNSSFFYMRSRRPLDASSWTAPAAVLRGGYVGAARGEPGRARQTYLSLACLPDDSLVIVFRQWRRGLDSDFGGNGYEALCLQRRPAGGKWSDVERLVMSARRGGYACFHEKLTVDGYGRLYLSLSYFNPADYPKARRAANRYHYRMVLVSKDGGAGWDFATTGDFLEGMTLAK
jgi:hypothetical protein